MYQHNWSVLPNWDTCMDTPLSPSCFPEYLDTYTSLNIIGKMHSLLNHHSEVCFLLFFFFIYISEACLSGLTSLSLKLEKSKRKK